MPQIDTIRATIDTSGFKINWSWLPSPEQLKEKLDSITFADVTEQEFISLEKIDRSEQYWPFLVIFSILCLFAFVRISYHNKYKNLIAAFLNARYMKQLLREELVLSHPFSILLLLQFVIVVSFLLFSWIEFLSVETFYSGWRLFVVLAVVVLALLLAKTFATIIIQFITGEDAGQTENRYNLLLFNQLCGIMLLPVAVVVQLGPDSLFRPSLFTGTFIITGVYMYRLFRSFLVGVTSGNTSFHLFLYLCTLEIIPLIVLIRLLVTKIG